MGKKDIFFISLILILVIVIIFKGCGEGKKADVIYNYETNTIRVPVPYEVEVEAKNITPPKIVIKWKDKPVPYEVEVIPDSLKLLIRNLKDSLKSVLIDKRFLTNFPESSKLINFNLQYDSLDITTLNIKGEIQSHKYPMDFNHYKYQWYDNELHHKDFKPPTPGTNKFNQLYIGAGYDFIHSSPLVSLDYYIDFGKIRVNTGTSMYLQTDPLIIGNAKVAYRLFK